MTRTTKPLLRYLTTPEGEDGGTGTTTASDTTPTTTSPEEDTVETTGEDEEDEDEEPEGSFDHARALRKIRKANAEAKHQRERAKAAEAKAATVDDLQRENADLTARLMRMEIANEFGLDPRLAARLQGANV